MNKSHWAFVVIASLFAACSSEGTDAPADGGTPDSGPAVGWQLGNGTPGSAQLVSIYSPSVQREATDLAFDPTSGLLWVVLREYEASATCNESGPTAPCRALEGSTLEIADATGANPTSEWKQDYNAWHFMRRPTSIAFGDADTRSAATPDVSHFFATCHEARTGNYDEDPVDYMGPAFWTSDPAVYSFNGPGGNGSHLDMLHGSPFCMGIAHKAGNAYWVFNGNIGSIDEYDFVEPHVAGGEDHSDGTIHRWVAEELSRVEDVPSHLEFDADSSFLYIADTGHGRIARLDTASGTQGGRFSPNYDNLTTAHFVRDAVLEDVVAPGLLEQPSGIALHDGTLFVTDHATSIIYAFDLNGELLTQFDTELEAGSLAGITVGPDNKVYIVNMQTSEVYRLDPSSP